MIGINELNEKYQKLKKENNNSIVKTLIFNILKIEKCELPLYLDTGGVCFIYQGNIYGYRYLIDSSGNELSPMFSKEAVFNGLREIYDELKEKTLDDVIWVRNVYSKVDNRFEIISNKNLDSYKDIIIKYFRFEEKEYIFNE